MSYNIVLAFLLSIINNMNCQLIQCNGGNCNCPSTSSPGALCTLECGEPSICSQVTINCRPNDPCQVTCAANQACSNLTINASNATDLTIICSATHACTNSINVSCGTGDCTLQCNGNDSCLDLSYSSTINRMAQTAAEFNLTTPTAILLMSLMACCAVMFGTTGFNCIYYKTLKRREQLFIQQNNNKIYSTSPVSPSMTTMPYRATVSSLSPVSQQLSVSPFETTNSYPGSPSAAELPPVPQVSMDENVDTEPRLELETCNHLSVPVPVEPLPVETLPVINAVHSTTYSQLPLTMKKLEFQVRMSNDKKDEQEQSDPESISISVSFTDSVRL